MKCMHLASSLCVAALTSAALTGCGGSSGGAGGSGGSSGKNPNELPVPSGITPYIEPSMSLGAGTILLSASGETLSLGGFDWPPSSMDDTCMVDGWQFTLYRYITVPTNVTLWADPNEVPTDQSKHGAVVAHVVGPWAIDLHKGGPLPGKGGGGEEALPFAQILAMDDGSAFDPTTTYGFGFSTIPAPKDVYNVNLDSTPGPDGLNDLDEYTNVMIPNGYSVLYEGVATYMGGAACNVGDSGTGSEEVKYDFSTLPQTVPFRLGFSTPTSYVNCQNGTDFGSQPGINGEDHPRGVQVSAANSIISQVTIHMDHPFWESFAENSPLHWDQIAAQYLGVTNPMATIEDLQFIGPPGAKTTKPLDFTAFTDNASKPIPWRTCDMGYYTTTGTGQLAFNPLKVNVTIGGTNPTVGLRNYYDFIRYTQATQGHLNSQGLCFIDRQYPSPPGGSG
jgi:hypothetical protein